MADLLKDSVNQAMVLTIATRINQTMPGFNVEGFTQDFAKGYETLELMPRCHYIAQCLHTHLPKHYPSAITILLESLGPAHPYTTDFSDLSFLHLPFSLFVSNYGLEHFEISMQAQYQITQRFSAEFSIRAFIEKYPSQCFELFETWVKDDNPHIRRLVSEGTRPRLPWASHLRELQADPTPIIGFLEVLKDDPKLYVRRSVANNLNDISKDHAQLVYSLLEQWQSNSNPLRDWVISHALRSAVKRSEPKALALLGYNNADNICVTHNQVAPTHTHIGSHIHIHIKLHNQGQSNKALMVDFAIHYIKANGKPKAKVYKWCKIELGAAQEKTLSKKVNLANLSTRTHYAGTHRIDIIINGQWSHLATFELNESI